MNINGNNEVLKRKYESYLEHSKGLGEASRKVARRALAEYDKFSENRDYKLFNKQKAIQFKEYLNEKKTAKTTHSNCLKQMKQFFEWLSMQPGYKSKITRESIEYLNLSRKEKQLLKTGKPKLTPALEDVKKLVASIPQNTEVELRDRALIAFLCSTGMRDSAVATLPMMAFDSKQMLVRQNPLLGVKTKFTKNIISKVYHFDPMLIQCICAWEKKLKEKGFGGKDPLFPSSLECKEEGNVSFKPASEVKPVFWKDGTNVQRIVKIRSEAANLTYFHPHTFRHLAIQLALEKAKTGAEIKAISQSFGHEEVMTTLGIYGNYTEEELVEKLLNIDARTEAQPIGNISSEAMAQIIQSILPSVIEKVQKRVNK